MPFDAHKNLAVSLVATPPSPATSGTTIVVTAGDGARFPAAPFNATVWPSTQVPTPLTAEIVRVTARTADTLTILRAQEGTTARAIVAGDVIAHTVTVKTITDLEAGVNFPALRSATDVVADRYVYSGYVIGGVDLALGSGNTVNPSAGASAMLGSNTSAATGRLELAAGQVAGGAVTVRTAAAERLRVHNSGGISIGTAADPGAGLVVWDGPTTTLQRGSPIVGSDFIQLGLVAGNTTNGLRIGKAGSGADLAVVFTNPNGQVGNITMSGTSTAYNTSSDARLKVDLGPVLDAAQVLRATQVHRFTWRADGTPGRGVFAQEAAEVAPYVVTPGDDVKPWTVDYAKYVPDLIAGWQHLAALVGALTDRVAALEARYEAAPSTAKNPPPPATDVGGTK